MHFEHEHEHTHTYTHSHEHSHEEGHEHEHVHHHDHEHAHDHAADHTPADQLVALVKYMTGHNEEHARELEDLAKKINENGKESACETILEAVSYFDKGNAVLRKALEELEK